MPWTLASLALGKEVPWAQPNLALAFLSSGSFPAVFMEGRAVFVAEPARAFPEGFPRPAWELTRSHALSLVRQSMVLVNGV